MELKKEIKQKIRIDSLRPGQVFCSYGSYYIVTDETDDSTNEFIRLCTDLESGTLDGFGGFEEVELVKGCFHYN